MEPGFDAKQFAADVEELAQETLREHIDPEAELKVLESIRNFAEDVCKQQVGDDERIACRAGCEHCCIVNVAVLLPEARSIACFIENRLSQDRLDELVERLSRLDRDTRCLDDEERIMSRAKCAFLSHEKSCSIYPVRPLLCRAVTSIDAEDCREALAMVAMGENRMILSNLIQREIFETAFTSFGRMLEKHGRDHRSHRLTGAVRSFLADSLQ